MAFYIINNQGQFIAHIWSGKIDNVLKYIENKKCGTNYRTIQEKI